MSGGTYNWDGSCITETSGYIVAVRNIFQGEPQEGHSFDLQDFLDTEKPTQPNTKLGYWEDDDTLYVDEVLICESRVLAELIGYARKELAIFDLANFESIYLEY
jgi:hypothetical protein